ncbi:hypothetical protein ACVWQR_00285 [Neisseria meningitidis]
MSKQTERRLPGNIRQKPASRSDSGVAGIVAGINAMPSERGMTFRRH